MAHLQLLPADILFKILLFMDPRSILSLRQVSPGLSALTKETYVWNMLLEQSDDFIPSRKHNISEIERSLVRGIDLTRIWNATSAAPTPRTYRFKSTTYNGAGYILFMKIYYCQYLVVGFRTGFKIYDLDVNGVVPVVNNVNESGMNDKYHHGHNAFVILNSHKSLILWKIDYPVTVTKLGTYSIVGTMSPTMPFNVAVTDFLFYSHVSTSTSIQTYRVVHVPTETIYSLQPDPNTEGEVPHYFHPILSPHHLVLLIPKARKTHIQIFRLPNIPSASGLLERSHTGELLYDIQEVSILSSTEFTITLLGLTASDSSSAVGSLSRIDILMDPSTHTLDILIIPLLISPLMDFYNLHFSLSSSGRVRGILGCFSWMRAFLAFECSLDGAYTHSYKLDVDSASSGYHVDFDGCSGRLCLQSKDEEIIVKDFSRRQAS